MSKRKSNRNRLGEFAELVGKVPDAKLAEMAGVTPEEVAAAREEARATEPEAPKVEAPPKPEAPKVEAKPEAPPKPENKVEPEPKSEPAPRLVRVLRGAQVRGPDGRTWRLSFADVYKDERAAWLWEHHRALVEPYRPKR